MDFGHVKLEWFQHTSRIGVSEFMLSSVERQQLRSRLVAIETDVGLHTSLAKTMLTLCCAEDVPVTASRITRKLYLTLKA